MKIDELYKILVETENNTFDRIKIYYHNDPDGYFGGAIVKMWADEHNARNNVEYNEMHYAKNIDLSDLKPTDKIVIVDFSFKPEIINKMLEVTQDIIWIDHHASAQGYKYNKELEGLRDFKDKSRSGCELAWNYFYPNKKMPLSVMLVGDYDAWKHKTKGDSTGFFNSLMANKLDISDSSSIVYKLIKDENLTQKMVEDGKKIEEYKMGRASDVVTKFGYPCTITGFEKYKAFACNALRGSLEFGIKMQEYDICIAYMHGYKGFTVSFYTEDRTGLDASVIAKSFGGGGHKGAAGCNNPDLSKIITPIQVQKP